MFALPDRASLERAGAAFEREPSVANELALAAALQVFSERADVLALYVARVGGRPLLS